MTCTWGKNLEMLSQIVWEAGWEDLKQKKCIKYMYRTWGMINKNSYTLYITYFSNFTYFTYFIPTLPLSLTCTCHRDWGMTCYLNSRRGAATIWEGQLFRSVLPEVWQLFESGIWSSEYSILLTLPTLPTIPLLLTCSGTCPGLILSPPNISSNVPLVIENLSLSWKLLRVVMIMREDITE